MPTSRRGNPARPPRTSIALQNRTPAPCPPRLLLLSSPDSRQPTPQQIAEEAKSAVVCTAQHRVVPSSEFLPLRRQGASVMQGGYGYGYGGGYGYDAAGGYGSAGGYDAAGGYVPAGGYGYGYAGAGGYGYPSAAPAYEDAAARRAHEFPAPLNGLEFQPSETCPKNYVIFDQTCTKSRVVFHPSLASKLGPAGSSASSGCAGKGGAYNDADGSCSVQQQHHHQEQQVQEEEEEDAEGIDALLSSEDGGDDDVVSTGRCGSSPDSTCSSASAACGRPRKKKERVKRMMRTLKGILPGGSQQMGAPAVLDEAVRYLKSLKVEAKKLGVRERDRGSDSS
ncbi:hypothetical protein BS78_10G218900 [Paspalum vaginatum]|nr:hypothetical protein BS78_10G218900 [Paspalum vaginatum]